jgi:hypothetical protein
MAYTSLDFPTQNPDWYQQENLKLPRSILGTGLVDIGFTEVTSKDNRGFIDETFYTLPLSTDAEIIASAAGQSTPEATTTDKSFSYMMMIEKSITTNKFKEFQERTNLAFTKINEMRELLVKRGANLNTVATIQGIFGDHNATPASGVLETATFQKVFGASAFDFSMLSQVAGLDGENAGNYNVCVMHSKAYNRVVGTLPNTGVTAEQLGMPAFQTGQIKLANGMAIVVNDTLCTPTADFTAKYGANTYPFYIGYDKPIYYQETTTTRIKSYETAVGGGTTEIYATTFAGGGVKGISWVDNVAPTAIATLQDETKYVKVYTQDENIKLRRGITTEA